MGSSQAASLGLRVTNVAALIERGSPLMDRSSRRGRVAGLHDGADDHTWVCGGLGLDALGAQIHPDLCMGVHALYRIRH